METSERFEMRPVPSAVRSEQGDDDPSRVSTADAACRLNVLGCRLGLTYHQHERQTRNVDAYREHVRGQDNVNGLGRIVNAHA